MNPRENFLAALHCKPHDWVPNFIADCAVAGFGALPGPWFEKGPMGGGYDGFGVRWVTPASGGGASIPAPGEFVLDDVTQWKEVVKFPDLDAFDFAEDAAMYLGDVDRTQKVVDFGSGNGPFERMAALMGFENALISMAVEPEASAELLNAITDYKLKVIERVAEFYKPDTFTNYDDIATESRPFFSLETYRALVKPCHARMNKACRDLGIIPIQHTCGKAEAFVEDWIETGAQCWTSVQPTNDIEGILQKHGDKISIMGGYNTNGLPGQTRDLSVIFDEVHRCIDTYGKYNGYIFFGFVLSNSLDPAEMMKILGPLIQESVVYAHKAAGK